MKKQIVVMLVACVAFQIYGASKKTIAASSPLDTIATKVATRIGSKDMQHGMAEFLGDQVESLSLTPAETNEFKKLITNMHEYLNMDSKEIKMLKYGNEQEIDYKIFEAQESIQNQMNELVDVINKKTAENPVFTNAKEDIKKADEMMLAEKRKIPEYAQLEQLRKEKDSIAVQLRKSIIDPQKADPRVKRWEALGAQYDQFVSSLGGALSGNNSERGRDIFKIYGNDILENIQKRLDATK